MKVKYRETQTGYYDGITTRSWEDKEVSVEKAGKLLTKMSEGNVLYYEALDALRRLSFSGDIKSSIVLSFVNFVILYASKWRDHKGPGSASAYADALRHIRALKIDTPFYTEICTRDKHSCPCTWCVEYRAEDCFERTGTRGREDAKYFADK